MFPTQRNMSTHDANMFTFEKPISCDYCKKLLKGLFYQGYHCNKCQGSMHKECISLLSKCGSSLPPALPPRPPSMQLPVSTNLLDNRFSNCSMDEGTYSSKLVTFRSLSTIFEQVLFLSGIPSLFQASQHCSYIVNLA